MEESFNLLLVGKSFDTMKLVLEYPGVQFAGHANVEGSREAAHDVDRVCFALAVHGSRGPSTALGKPRSAQDDRIDWVISERSDLDHL